MCETLQLFAIFLQPYVKHTHIHTRSHAWGETVLMLEI